MATSDSSDKTPRANNLELNIDYRVIIISLIVIILCMLGAWRPWDGASADSDSRTVKVTGESKITAEPDEFVFYPTYEFKNADKAAALSELTKKSDETVAKLKELGVADNKIKTDSDGQNYPELYYGRPDGQDTYNLRLTVTVDSREKAQKIQDYLVSTSPQGFVSPQAGFSDQKRKELEDKARDEATKDARKKADQSAKNLGFKVGKVKSIDDGSNFGGPIPLYGMGAAEIATDQAAPDRKLAVQPGENDLHYTVTVVYFLR